MRIGIVCSPTFGGSGVVATELGQQLVRQGHEVHFVSYQRPERLMYLDNLYFHQVSYDPYPFFHYHPYSLALASTMAEVVEEHKIDILHAHYAIPHAISAILAKDMLPNHPVKVITTLHGTDITLVGQTRSYFPLTQLAINKSDGVSVVSDYLLKRTVSTFDIQRDIKVIPNAVDLQRFTKVTAESVKQFRQHYPSADKIITHISNFRPVKRIADVIKVFEKIQKNTVSHLLMVGDGPEKSSAVNLVNSLGIKNKVTFLGTSQYIETICASSDLFLLPSEHESFGLSALEAMAAGCPVVATEGSGVAEFVTSGVDGELAAVGDIDAMVEAANKILLHHHRYKEAAVKTACQFDLTGMALVYENFYRDILKLKSNDV